MTALTLSGMGLLGAALLAVLPAGRRLAVSRLDLPAIVALVACSVAAAAGGHVALTGVRDDVGAAWDVPFGSFALHLDALAGLFLLPILVVGGLGIVYGREYLETDEHGRGNGAAWCWYYLFIASMALVVLASNAVLFLVAWEAMSVAAFFLVVYESEDPTVRHAGWMFLVAAHIGTACLLAMFAILGRGAETLDFANLQGAAGSGPLAAAVVLLGLAGFGIKAGLVPGHIWLPFAHPAAPSHVSALMSGAMLKVGIYGLLRTFTFLPAVPTWAGAVVLAFGLFSAVYAVLLALAQHDLKRLLAFSSIENVGIIFTGLGIGLIGVAHDAPTVAALGFAGALVHVLNHALFKGLLFLGAGAVQRASGTCELERLGGLMRTMPWTGRSFFVGSAAISGLPPLNGFIGEFLIYSAALVGVASGDRGLAAGMVATIGVLALTGGLAAAVFAKAFGVVFIGLPRTDAAMVEGEPGRWMRWPMGALALACTALGLLPFAALRMVRHATVEASGASLDVTIAGLAPASAALERVALVAGVLLAIVLALVALRARLLASTHTTLAPTWTTAYLAPDPRMQYTASSFAAPLTTLFRRVLRMESTQVALDDYFPGASRYDTRARGLIREPILEPLFRTGARAAIRLRWLQHGRIQLYLMNIAAALLVLLIWKLGL